MSSGCPYAKLYQEEPHPDPYAVYAQMREEYGPVVPVELEPGVRGWLVTDYNTLISWCRDTTGFTHDPRLWKDYAEGRIDDSAAVVPMMAPRPNALFTDGAEHQRYRRAISDSFGAVSEQHLASVTREVADSLVDTFCERGESDLLNEFARLLPLLVMSVVFGMDEERALRFARASRDLWTGVDAERANAEAERALSETVSDKHRAPGDDVTSRLVQHRAALTDEEVIMQMLLMVTAANEPTANLVNSTLRAALTEPDRNPERYRTDGELGALVDRVLWQDPPITNYPVIYPRVDVPAGGGRTIEAGSPILLGFAAANRFFAEENADHIAESANRAHVAWGAGPHRCPARDQAVTITTAAVRTVLHRLPSLRLAVPPEELRWNLTGLSWVPVSLPTVFEPQAPLSHATVEGTHWSPSESPRETSAPKRPTSGRSPLSSLSSFLGKLLRGS